MPMNMLKIRLFPTKGQETKLATTLQTCRDVYNSFLLWRIAAWETQQKSLDYHEQATVLPDWKAEHPELKEVHSQVLQNVAVRVDLAFKAFFRRCKAGQTPGFPRFKGQGYDSITYPQSGFALGENCVILSKLGVVKAVVHRRLEGAYKTCTIRRQGEKWFACFAVEVKEEALPPSEESVGIDVGLNHFAALSHGDFVENPRFLRKEEKARAKAQRKLAGQKKGSKEQWRAKKVVRRIEERIRNRRHNFVHQIARRLVNRFGLLAVEKLPIENMRKRPKPQQAEESGEFVPNGASQKAGLNKSISDAAWGMFREVLKSKAESADRRVVEVHPAYTSQDCSGCGYRPEKEHRKKLSDRWHFCPMCGLSLDRDINAAINILKLALELVFKNTVGQHSVNAIAL